MIKEVILPKQGLQMTEGYITKWIVNEGDNVKKGDPLFEMETDKTVITVESGYDGKLIKIIHDSGETVPVATVIGYIGDADEKAPDVTPTSVVEKERVFITPRAKTVAQQNNVPIETIVPSGPDNLIIARDVRVANNVSMLAIKVSLTSILDIISKQGTSGEKIIGKCIDASLKRCKLGNKIKVTDFNIRFLTYSSVSLFVSASAKPSIYVGKPDKDGEGYVTFTLDSNIVTEEETLEFADMLYMFIEKPLLAYV